jgi:hypothetical protein
MGQTSEYGIAGLARLSPPDPEGHKGAYAQWAAAGVPVYQFTIQGSTHFEWSLIPAFPATSWCPETREGRCEGGWARPMAEHYSVAWLDRWLKRAGEPGYDDADARLLADAAWQPRLSFYSRSARQYPARNGHQIACEDLRAGCPQDLKAIADSRGDGGSGGGVLGGWLLAVLMLAGLRRRMRR